MIGLPDSPEKRRRRPANTASFLAWRSRPAAGAARESAGRPDSPDMPALRPL